MKTNLAIMLSILLWAGTARADLKWEQTQIELHPAVGDKEAVGHFKYKNTGEQPVRIKSVKSSCGCTTAQTQKNQVGPGENGEITATFKIGDRVGTQVKTVTVETDDRTPNTTLMLKAVIPQMLEIQPAMVFWQMGDPPKFKSVTVKAGKDFPVKEIKATPSGQDFETKISKVSDGEFKIDIQPRDTARAVATTITLQPDNSPKKFYVTARVMNAAPAAKTTSAQP
jgi:hypothetical protein